MLGQFHEPARHTPVMLDVDVLVLGGSCTGLFAAIRAARLGCRVAVVEKAGCFGGVATLSLVNIWHSPFDTVHERQIIAGLTVETMDRLRTRDAVTQGTNPRGHWTFNPPELQIELDELLTDAGVIPLLHTLFVAPHIQDGRLVGVIVENKSGRQAIRARMFIDATGDGDLCHRLRLETYTNAAPQPSTTCAILAGAIEGSELSRALRDHRAEFNLPEGFAWGASVPPHGHTRMYAGTRVFGADCADATSLTRAEIEGRRQVRALMDIVRKYIPDAGISLQALPARIGIRETRHVRCRYQLTGDDILMGRRFEDAIANGSYPADVHHHDRPGITFRYLNGEQVYVRPDIPAEKSRWRPPTATDPTFYQVPFRSLLPANGFDNLIVAGRMLDADTIAHGAVRVMVNMNQTGEAAGVAAYLALHQGKAIADLDVAELRRTLASGGSLII